MRRFTLKRLVIGAGGAVSVLIVALLVLPALIDINAYKPEIAAEVKQETGRELAIDGPVSLSLLPFPTVRLEGVRFADLVQAKSIAVQPSLLALLSGRFAVSTVSLIEPKVALQVDANGQPNWMLASSAGDSRSLPARFVSVENGTLSFNDAQTGLSVSVNKMNVTASAETMDGPFRMTAGATLDDSPIKIDLSLSAKRPTGYDASAALEVAGGELTYKGTLSELGPGATLSGRASASADNLVLFIETLARIAGQPQPSLPRLLAGAFRYDGPVELSRTAFATKDFSLVLGEDKGTGSLTATFQPMPAVDARFTASRFDLDRWLQAVVLPPDLTEAKLPDLPSSDRPSPGRPTPPPAPPSHPSWLASLNARLALEVGEVIYHKQAVRGVALELDARGGAVAVPKFSATLPGDLVIEASSAIAGDSARPNVPPSVPPNVSGEFKLEGPKLRETLAWLKVDLSQVPADKLTRLSMNGKMSSRGGNVEVDDLVFALDDLKGAGGITVAFSNPMSISTRLQLANLDLDSYIVPGGQSTEFKLPADSAVPVLALLGPTLSLKLEVGRIKYRSDVVSGVSLDIVRHGGTFRLNELRIANLDGGRLELRSAVVNYWTAQPRANIEFSFDSPNRTTLRATGVLALRGGKEGDIHALSYAGNVVINGQRIEASIEADFTGRPYISADLKTDSLDLGKLDHAGAALEPQPRNRPAAEAQSLDTALMRRFDGKFTITVGSMDVAAELKNSRLTITQLKAGLYGGVLQLKGVVDATRPSLTFDLGGEASGIRIGDMMRGLSGSNEVGSLIKITFDGILNAHDIALRGEGSTVDQLKNSLAGGARVSGHIYPRADRFLQVVGAAATGIVGGAIDLTLGNLASLFGHKQGVEAGNLLNAISLVLNRYVNRDNPLSGEVDIAGGILSDRQLRLQGNGATAAIATRTNLANATTETTVNFTLSEDPSAPYLIVTVHGALAGPAVAASRGSAKDPPGMTNILSTIEKAPSLLPHITLPKLDIPNPFGR